MFYAIVIVIAIMILAGVVAYFTVPAVKKEVAAIEARVKSLEGATADDVHAKVAKVENSPGTPASAKIVQPAVVVSHVKAAAVAETAAQKAADDAKAQAAHFAEAEQALADKKAGKLVPAPAPAPKAS